MKNKSQLVCQHLENISRDALEKHQEVVKNYAKGKHGIYALFSKERLYYVGLASDLRSRLKNHLHDRHANTWDRFSIYLTVNNEHLKDLEALVLKIAAPKGNKQTGKFSVSQNLMPSFKQDIKDKHRSEMDHLVGRKRQPSAAKKTKAGTPAKAEKSSRTPTLAPYIEQPLKIRWTYKDTTYKATVRKDGTILSGGKVYNSPSLAAAAIAGRPINGWVSWQYQKPTGEWVLLDILRKK